MELAKVFIFENKIGVKYETNHNGDFTHEIGGKGQVIPFPPETKHYTVWRFTVDESNHFKTTLSGFDSDKVGYFILSLELLCRDRKRLMKTDSQRDKIADYRKDVIANGRDYLKQLRAVKMNRKSVIPQYSLSGKMANTVYGTPYIQNTEDEYLRTVLDKSFNAYNALADFIQVLESPPFAVKKQGGRPKADTDNFVYFMARIFRDTFATNPTLYADGVFADTVSIALEAVGLPHNYPQKRIKAAIDRLTNADH